MEGFFFFSLKNFGLFLKAESTVPAQKQPLHLIN